MLALGLTACGDDADTDDRPGSAPGTAEPATTVTGDGDESSVDPRIEEYCDLIEEYRDLSDDAEADPTGEAADELSALGQELADLAVSIPAAGLSAEDSSRFLDCVSSAPDP